MITAPEELDEELLEEELLDAELLELLELLLEALDELLEEACPRLPPQPANASPASNTPVNQIL